MHVHTLGDVQPGAVPILPTDAEFAVFASKAARAGDTPLVWQTKTPEIWDKYLDCFPAEHRRYHDCRACRKFIETYGSLVTIGEHGDVRAAFWNVEPGDTSYYGKVALQMRNLLARATPTRPLFDEGVGCHLGYRAWGVVRTGTIETEQHHHWWGRPAPAWMRLADPGTGDAFAAEIEQGVKVVNAALDDYAWHTILLAQELIQLGRITRSEKVSAVIDALVAINKVPIRPPHTATRDNLIRYWLGRVPQLAHVQSSVAATLLRDLGLMSVEDAIARFAPKMEGTKYMRPTAAPAAQTLERADALFVEKGYDRALARRWTRVDEIPCFWKPAPAEAPAEESAVFKGVKSRSAVPATPPTPSLKPQTMSWVVFERDVLPLARSIEVWIPGVPLPFLFFTSPTNADAPNILRTPDGHGHYRYTDGNFGSAANLRENVWYPVAGLGRIFGGRPVALISGARDIRHTGHTGLFPEVLIPELYPYRAVIEAYNKANPMPPATADDNTIAGLLVASGVSLRVTTGTAVTPINIDRFE